MEFKLPIQGNAIYYPLNTWSVKMSLEASNSTLPVNFVDPKTFSLPVKIDLIDTNYAFKPVVVLNSASYTKPADRLSDSPSGIFLRRIETTLSMEPGFVWFPLASVIALLVVSLVMLCIVYTIWTAPPECVKDTKAFVPAMAVLIFAIPKYRQELPFAPPVGIALDYYVLMVYTNSTVPTYL